MEPAICPRHPDNACLIHPLGLSGREHMTGVEKRALSRIRKDQQDLAEEIRKRIREEIAKETP